MITEEDIGRRIYLVQNHRVIFDSDLAKLYGVTTFNLNKAVKRNRDRFPKDFMFQLTAKDAQNLVFQTGISSLKSENPAWGGRRYHPYVFTEQGVAMLSSILRSKRAVRVNIAIMRTFVKFRGMLSAHKDLAKRLDELERRMSNHDEHTQSLFDAIRQIMDPAKEPPRRIGFQP